MAEPKPRRKGLLRSKTFWANVLTAGAGVVAVLSQSDFIAQNPQVVGIMATVQSVMNVFLRLVSSDEVTVTGN